MGTTHLVKALLLGTVACGSSGELGPDAAAGSGDSGSGAGGDAGVEADALVLGADPHPLFPALDRATVPFHAGAGTWGPQRTLPAATVATGGTAVTVTNQGQLEAALALGNRTITIGADITVSGGLRVDAPGYINNIVVIVPPGRTLALSTWINEDSVGRVGRIYIRGTTPGVFSGGQVHMPFFFGPWDSIVIDGVSISGPGTLGGDGVPAVYMAGPAINHGAIVNSRSNCGAAFFLGTVHHFLAAGNSIQTGQKTPRPAPGTDESWGWRFGIEDAGGTIAIYDNEYRATRYSAIRLHPKIPNAGTYAWIANNHFVDLVEGKLLWVYAFAGGGETATDQMAAWWLVNNVGDFAGGEQIDSIDSDHGFHMNNTYYSSTYDAATPLMTNGTLQASGNTFLTPRSVPAWTHDPSNIDWDNWDN